MTYSSRPACFTIMPFGLKPSIAGGTVDFDAIYHDLIHPAVIVAGLEPVRANDELGRIIHRSMFERLILGEFVLVDLTIADPNVFYELGVRHAVCRASTILIFAEGVTHLPFDVVMIRPIQYRLAPEGIPEPEGVAAAQSALTKRLLEAKSATTDSPLYQMFEDFPNVDKSRSWVFREKAEYIGRMKDRLAKAHFRGAEAVRAVEKELGDIRSQEAGVVVELFLSYRAVSAWSDMIELVGKMTPSLAATPLVREQLALALNRVGRGDEAERLLLSLLADRGPSSETYGILGRVYKDRWQQAAKEGKTDQARDLLNKAIDAYLRGFDMDWRDAYPGINALTLMELSQPPDPRRHELIPVVRYAVQRRIAASQPDYWDLAIVLELAVLALDEQAARVALKDALAAARERWELSTTSRNLRLICEARSRRGEDVSWATEIVNALGAVDAGLNTSL